ncbi:hypothetical protein HUC00_28615 [Bacillus mycoides]|nr:hypothetical protein [Bacillus mycoides]
MNKNEAKTIFVDTMLNIKNNRKTRVKGRLNGNNRKSLLLAVMRGEGIGNSKSLAKRLNKIQAVRTPDGIVILASDEHDVAEKIEKVRAKNIVVINCNIDPFVLFVNLILNIASVKRVMMALCTKKN